MPRPSRQIDRALLASGRALFPAAGCARLSVRAVAEHAGVNRAMFHYHFDSKEAFLRALLQEMYEEMFASLAGSAQGEGLALPRLERALGALARFARAHRQLVARVWMDAMGGEAVAREFFRLNAPRHVGLLLALMQQAEHEGALAGEAPPVQRFAFLMSSVLLPVVFVAGLLDAGLELPGLHARFEAEVMSDGAIDQRVALALAALAPRARVLPAASRSRRRDAA
ncbi:MAG: TetR family transcriptional regulator [Caldimonas sp.]